MLSLKSVIAVKLPPNCFFSSPLRDTTEDKNVLKRGNNHTEENENDRSLTNVFLVDLKFTFPIEGEY